MHKSQDPMKPSTKKTHVLESISMVYFDHVEAAALDVHQTSPNAMALLVAPVSEVPFVMDTVFISVATCVYSTKKA